MTIEVLSKHLVHAIVAHDGGNGWKTNAQHWATILDQQNDGARLVLVAMRAADAVGYGSLLWRSTYPPFAAAGIPEIHDLVVSNASRRQGIATRLIRELEQAAVAEGCKSIGLGVGLYADYGPAHRLYASLGYVPDGRGVTYDGVPVASGSSARVDDRLVLWLVKALSPAPR